MSQEELLQRAAKRLGVDVESLRRFQRKSPEGEEKQTFFGSTGPVMYLREDPAAKISRDTGNSKEDRDE